MKMVILDGSSVEGGGQIPRTALALSMVTGQPFRVKNIRASRAKPGLLKQHVAVIESAMRLCSAGVDGVSLGSSEFTFFPGDVLAGDYEFNLSSAIPISLVLQTILPVLALAKGSSVVTVEGGAGNRNAPPVEFFIKTYLPQIVKMGPTASLQAASAGLLPMGTGRYRMTVTPGVVFRPITLVDRGVPIQRRAMTSVTNLTGHQAAQEVRDLEKTLGLANLSMKNGPGNVMLEMSYEGITEVFTGFAKQGVSAEEVTASAASQAKRYMTSKAAICEFLADQLMIPMALAGSGRFTTTKISSHAKANMETIRAFLPVEFWTDQLPDGSWLMEVRRA
jgi:RNA 3'-terminal phosphate cyclase (ATP)